MTLYSDLHTNKCSKHTHHFYHVRHAIITEEWNTKIYTNPSRRQHPQRKLKHEILPRRGKTDYKYITSRFTITLCVPLTGSLHLVAPSLLFLSWSAFYLLSFPSLVESSRFLSSLRHTYTHDKFGPRNPPAKTTLPREQQRTSLATTNIYSRSSRCSWKSHYISYCVRSDSCLQISISPWCGCQELGQLLVSCRFLNCWIKDLLLWSTTIKPGLKHNNNVGSPVLVVLVFTFPSLVTSNVKMVAIILIHVSWHLFNTSCKKHIETCWKQVLTCLMKPKFERVLTLKGRNTEILTDPNFFLVQHTRDANTGTQSLQTQFLLYRGRKYIPLGSSQKVHHELLQTEVQGVLLLLSYPITVTLAWGERGHLHKPQLLSDTEK